jgi:7-carboxy-7-deazaguanine synthase
MLRINEIYPAILGESMDSGWPCVIVRLTGCHRRCLYCDTAHAFHGGRWLAVEEIIATVAGHGLATVLVTGGEPLLQASTPALLERLLQAGYRVVLETSGTLGAQPLARVPIGVRRVVDVKTPGSGIHSHEIDWQSIADLAEGDELKFVICDRADYEWARDLLRQGDRVPSGPVRTFSPSHGQLDPARLAEWILADRLDVRLQVQLHKVLWPQKERGT